MVRVRVRVKHAGMGKGKGKKVKGKDSHRRNPNQKPLPKDSETLLSYYGRPSVYRLFSFMMTPALTMVSPAR